MSKNLVLYSTIVGGFYAQTDELNAAIAQARQAVGDDVWKRGFSENDPQGATLAAKGAFAKHDIKPIAVKGKLTHVGFVENRDASGNLYPKVRVGLQNGEDELLLSIDLKSDVAQRLIPKLDNCMPGLGIEISAWPTMVERAGRTFVNHAVSMKDEEGVQVPANSEFSANVKKLTDGVEPALRAAGISDPKVIAAAKVNKRVDEHKALLLEIASRFETVPA